jgi:hypothetical protein
MMEIEVVYKKGVYEIDLIKIDNCPPRFISMIPEPLITLLAIFMLPILLIGSLMKEDFLSDRRGISIRMNRGNTLVRSFEYPYTDNLDKDAKEIKRIIDSYKYEIDKAIEEKNLRMKREQEYSEKSSTKFKEMVERVKVK